VVSVCTHAHVSVCRASRDVQVHYCNEVCACTCIVISATTKISHVGHLHSTNFGAFINTGVLHGQFVIMNNLRFGGWEYMSCHRYLLNYAIAFGAYAPSQTVSAARNRVPASFSDPNCALRDLLPSGRPARAVCLN
jgi:hypothetical protein